MLVCVVVVVVVVIVCCCCCCCGCFLCCCCCVSVVVVGVVVVVDRDVLPCNACVVFGVGAVGAVVGDLVMDMMSLVLMAVLLCLS